MDDSIDDERENLRYDLALLSELRANVQGDLIAVDRDTLFAMPEPLDHVSITVDRGGEANAVRLPWRSRDFLLRKLRTTDGAEEIVKAFEDVGATRPVELNTEQKVVLYGVLDDRSFTSGFHELPEGFFELRNALSDEVTEASENDSAVGES